MLPKVAKEVVVEICVYPSFGYLSYAHVYNTLCLPKTLNILP